MSAPSVRLIHPFLFLHIYKGIREKYGTRVYMTNTTVSLPFAPWTVIEVDRETEATRIKSTK